MCISLYISICIFIFMSIFFFSAARMNMKLVSIVGKFDHAGRRAVQLHSLHDVKMKMTGCSIAWMRGEWGKWPLQRPKSLMGQQRDHVESRPNSTRSRVGFTTQIAPF